MSHHVRERSRNAQHAIAVKQTKTQQTGNKRRNGTQPTNKQPKRAHRDKRSKTPRQKQGAQPPANNTTRKHKETP
jgi:hypothetical protein